MKQNEAEDDLEKIQALNQEIKACHQTSAQMIKHHQLEITSKGVEEGHLKIQVLNQEIKACHQTSVQMIL